MNCEDTNQLLMDLLYDELPPQQWKEALEHVAACPKCSQEYARLQKARSLLKHAFAGEPAGVRAIKALDSAASARKILRVPWRTTLAASAAAAAAIILVAAFLLPGPTVDILPQAYAAGPVKIEKVNVSVTILSQPPEWGQMLDGREMAQAANQMKMQTLQTDYQYDRSGRVVWPGMALVRDQRLVANLPQGASRVQFTDVPTGIMPDTVRLRSLDAPDGVKILEQNYQYDLAGAWAILNKYVDKSITVAYKDGNIVTGKLLSFDNKALIIQPDQPATRYLLEFPSVLTITRREVRSIAFEKLPEGLLTRPTLLWELDNKAKAHQQLEVAYMTTGLQWRADYVLKLRPANVVANAATTALKITAPKATAPGAAATGTSATSKETWKESPIADFIDSADLVGYATVSNNSGVSFKDAQLKLIAGDTHLIPPPQITHGYAYVDEAVKLNELGIHKPQFAEKSFFEYHLYTLQRPADIADREVKQLELISGSGIKMRREYVFDPQANATAARVVSVIENKEENGLGIPLPKGVMRLYAPDPDGMDQYVSQTEIDHTPVKEKLRLPWGYAFDVVCEARQVDRERLRGDEWKDSTTFTIRNHKDNDVNVTVIARVPITAIRASCNYRWHVREVGVVEILVPVKADTQAKVDFNVEYGTTHGGGLKSPYDEDK